MVDDDGERKVPVRLFEKLSIVPDNDSFAPAKKVMSDLAEKVSKMHWGFVIRMEGGLVIRSYSDDESLSG